MILAFAMVNWVKLRLPSPNWVGLIQSDKDLNRSKDWPSPELEETPPVCFELRHWFFFFPWLQTLTEKLALLRSWTTGFWTWTYIIRFSGSQTFGLKLEITASALLGLWLTDCRSWDLSVSVIAWAILVVNSYISPYPISSVSLENPD